MAKLTINIPAIKPIETFFEYLQKRALDKVHEDNRDLIADFIDKVLVVEMKRLANDNEVIQEIIEVPDNLLRPPKAATPTAAQQEAFNKVLDQAAQIDPNEITAAEPKSPVAPAPAKAARSGNGHRKLKERNLLDSERDQIRAYFVTKNGQMDDNDSHPIFSALQTASDVRGDKKLSVAQVTGFVSLLHNYITDGDQRAPVLPDYQAYIKFMEENRAEWGEWNSPKWRAFKARHVTPKKG